jgi:hypothetical protein
MEEATHYDFAILDVSSEEAEGGVVESIKDVRLIVVMNKVAYDVPDV